MTIPYPILNDFHFAIQTRYSKSVRKNVTALVCSNTTENTFKDNVYRKTHGLQTTEIIIQYNVLWFTVSVDYYYKDL